MTDKSNLLKFQILELRLQGWDSDTCDEHDWYRFQSLCSILPSLLAVMWWQKLYLRKFVKTQISPLNAPERVCFAAETALIFKRSTGCPILKGKFWRLSISFENTPFYDYLSWKNKEHKQSESVHHWMVKKIQWSTIASWTIWRHSVLYHCLILLLLFVNIL